MNKERGCPFFIIIIIQLKKKIRTIKTKQKSSDLIETNMFYEIFTDSFYFAYMVIQIMIH